MGTSTGMNMSMSKLESAGTAERETRVPARARASRSRRASGRARRDGGPAGFGGRLSSARDRQQVRERNAAERTRVEEMPRVGTDRCESRECLFRLPHLLLLSSLGLPPVRFISERFPAARRDVPSARAARLCGTRYSKRARPCVYRNASIANTDGRLDLVHDGASWVRG